METVLIGPPGAEVCEVVIAPGALDGGVPASAEGAAALLPARDDRRRVAVLVQPGSAPIGQAITSGLASAGWAAAMREVPDREAGKTLSVAEEVYLWLNELALTRHDTVMGVGGGALTDLAGFVAATYLRGVECVLVPTTLLAAVDAAIGGKSGVNVGGKNLVGAFRHPSRVVIDPDHIAALPEPLRREGSAEAIKAGFIGDPELVALYETHGLDAPMREVIERSVAVKARVVSADFRESGRRAILNYGHTLGHAVEIAARMSHGEAVAVGMVAAGAASAQALGFDELDRHVDLLNRVGLPTQSPPVDKAEITALVKLDKKRDAGGLRMVLLQSTGVPVVRHVDDATVAVALAAVGID